jgi:glycosyltransferase involved in cell wall biosynthesis
MNQVTRTPTVSVIIPCFNARRWIEETLRSALQPSSHAAEVIVVDDGSTDGSSNLVRASFPQVRLFTTPNHGVSQARNRGVEESRGKYVTFLDADDLLVAGKVDRQVALLDATGADVAYGDWQRLRVGPNGEFHPADKVERAMERAPELELLGLFWCPTGAYLFRRSIVERVGGFNPRLPVIQDARFALDCALHGGRFVHDPHLSCLYRVHTAGSVSTRSQQAFWRDVLASAVEVREWWERRSELTDERRTAVLEVADTVARATAIFDSDTFVAASQEVERHLGVRPPPARRSVQALIRLFGYRRYRAMVARARHWLHARPDAPVTSRVADGVGHA